VTEIKSGCGGETLLEEADPVDWVLGSGEREIEWVWAI